MKNNVFVAFAALLLFGCGNNDGQRVESEEHRHSDNEIVVSPDDASRFGIEVEKVSPSKFSEVVKVMGEILPAASDQAVVSAPTSGVVTLSKGITKGKSVRVGERVASVSAKGITGGDQNEAAKVNLDAAKRELDRITPLLADGIVTKKDYNEALQAYESAKAAYSSRAAGGVATSPISGVIGEIMVVDGTYVEAGQAIATVARSTRLTLKALLPQKYISFLPVIETANIIPAQTGNVISLKEYGGKLMSSAVASGNDVQGYIPVYFSFDNNGLVTPGSPSDVYLVGRAKAEALTVPVSAISEQMGETFVYVKKDAHGYEKRAVKIGKNDGMRAEITDGIAVGDSVVINGVSFVRLAETSTVVPEGHSHSH